MDRFDDDGRDDMQQLQRLLLPLRDCLWGEEPFGQDSSLGCAECSAGLRVSFDRQVRRGSVCACGRVCTEGKAEVLCRYGSCAVFLSYAVAQESAAHFCA